MSSKKLWLSGSRNTGLLEYCRPSPGLGRIRRIAAAVLITSALAMAAGSIAPNLPVAQASNTQTTNFISWNALSGTTGSASFASSSYSYNTTASGTLDVFNPPGAQTATTSVYVKLTGEVTQYSDTSGFNWGALNLTLPGGASLSGTGASIAVVGSPTGGVKEQVIEFFSDPGLTTTTSVSNVVMPIYSLGNPNLEGVWVFEQDLVVISSENMQLDKTSLGKDRLTGSEGHAVIQFLGTFDKIQFEVEQPELFASWNMAATNVAPPASALSANRLAVTGVTGTAITPVLFTATTSVSGQQTYVLTGVLPTGLSFSTTTGAITGTPTEVTASASVIVTVKDSQWGDVSVTITFTFAAPAPLNPALPTMITAPTVTSPPTTASPLVTTPVPLRVEGALPSLPPGQSQVFLDGVAESIEIFVEASTDLVMRGQDFELRLAGECTVGCQISTTAEGRQVLELEQNGLANVSGDGFMPGTPVFVWLFSEPRFLGELAVGADGTFTGAVQLGDIAVGEHTLQVNGTSFDGVPRSANLGVVVIPVPGALPSTGADVGSLWVLAFSLFALGLILTVRRRPVVMR